MDPIKADNFKKIGDRTFAKGDDDKWYDIKMPGARFSEVDILKMQIKQLKIDND